MIRKQIWQKKKSSTFHLGKWSTNGGVPNSSHVFWVLVPTRFLGFSYPHSGSSPGAKETRGPVLRRRGRLLAVLRCAPPQKDSYRPSRSPQKNACFTMFDTIVFERLPALHQVLDIFGVFLEGLAILKKAFDKWRTGGRDNFPLPQVLRHGEKRGENRWSARWSCYHILVTV